MIKCIFVISADDKKDLQALADSNGKSMSKLIREAVPLLKIAYSRLPEVYNEKSTGIPDKKSKEVDLDG